MNAAAKVVEAQVLDRAPDAPPAPAQGAMIISALSQAIALPDQGVERLERLWSMQKEMLDRDRAEAYANAMSRAQQRMPRIAKDKDNQQTRSKYAALETILAAITPIYTDEGFSLSFGTVKSDLDAHVGITCDVMHTAGHVRQYHYDAPIDDKGMKGEVNKTQTHGRGSAISYGRRYLTCMIFNLTIGGEDDDGNGAGGSGYGDAVLAKVADFESAILGAADTTELERIGKDIAKAALPGKLQTRVRAVYGARGRQLASNKKAGAR